MKLCLVANELLGAAKNGGIGTATSHLALFLAREGHEVGVAYSGSHPLDHRHPWVVRLRSAGVVITHLDVGRAEIYPDWLRESTVLFDYLRTGDFDLILFQDWEGPGYASIVARRAGLAFPRTRLGVLAHGPTAWLIEANRTRARTATALAKLEMERVAFAEADFVLSPSRYLRDWLVDNGHALAGDTAVLPLYLWSDHESDDIVRRRVPLAEVRTIAFYGRMEERKGIELFLKALTSDRLAFGDFSVVFLGKAASHTPEAITAYVQKRRPSLVPRLRFETDLDSDQAQRFLVDEDCLAVIPSLTDNAPCVISECLRRAIPFLATQTGGIPELVDRETARHALVAPEAAALAARLAELLGRPLPPGKPAYDEPSVAQRWRAWLAAHPPLGDRPTDPEPLPAPALRIPQGPTLSIVVTHYERPQLVMQTMESLAAQTCPDFEVIFVDDGSRTEAALHRLDEIERGNWPFGLTMLRGENRYLGAARNRGIKAAKAQRLIFMDDDNVAFPTMAEVLSRASTSSGADIVTCQLAVFTDPVREPNLALLDQGERWGFTAGPAELGVSVNCFGDATGLYRREVFDRIGYFHEWRDVGHEDWHFHARAALAGLRIVSLPVPLYWYRRTETGMFNTTDRYRNNKIIWDLYVEAMPPHLARLVDLSVCNEFGVERIR